jgi:hypothetical protein
MKTEQNSNFIYARTNKNSNNTSLDKGSSLNLGNLDKFIIKQRFTRNNSNAKTHLPINMDIPKTHRDSQRSDKKKTMIKSSLGCKRSCIPKPYKGLRSTSTNLLSRDQKLQQRDSISKTNFYFKLKGLNEKIKMYNQVTERSSQKSDNNRSEKATKKL